MILGLIGVGSAGQQSPFVFAFLSLIVETVAMLSILVTFVLIVRRKMNPEDDAIHVDTRSLEQALGKSTSNKSDTASSNNETANPL